MSGLCAGQSNLSFRSNTITPQRCKQMYLCKCLPNNRSCSLNGDKCVLNSVTLLFGVEVPQPEENADNLLYRHDKSKTLMSFDKRAIITYLLLWKLLIKLQSYFKDGRLFPLNSDARTAKNSAWWVLFPVNECELQSETDLIFRLCVSGMLLSPRQSCYVTLPYCNVPTMFLFAFHSNPTG